MPVEKRSTGLEGVSSRGHVYPDAVGFGSFNCDEYVEIVLATLGVDTVESVDTRIPAKESRILGYLVNVSEDAFGPLEVNDRLRYRFHSQNVIYFAFVKHSNIGKNCTVGPFTWIQRDVIIGSDARVESHNIIYSKVDIEGEVFI